MVVRENDHCRAPAVIGSFPGNLALVRKDIAVDSVLLASQLRNNRHVVHMVPVKLVIRTPIQTVDRIHQKCPVVVGPTVKLTVMDLVVAAVAVVIAVIDVDPCVAATAKITVTDLPVGAAIERDVVLGITLGRASAILKRILHRVLTVERAMILDNTVIRAIDGPQPVGRGPGQDLAAVKGDVVAVVQADGRTTPPEFQIHERKIGFPGA